MHLHWGWAVLGALALGGGLAWWTTRYDGGDSHARASSHPLAQDQAGRPDGAGPTVFYRWVDAGGSINVSSAKPPAGIRYTVVHIDPNQNIVPMGTGDSGSPVASTAH
ncbi:MAG TPA: DUF4124 domain-containing protein [Xanthomonadaceae bacterium]|jgi:hypothetical protein